MEEAKAMSNEKIINVIETFQRDNPSLSNDKRSADTELQTTVVQLSQRVQYLESLLTEVSKIGGVLKTKTSGAGADPHIAELASKLASIDTTPANSYDSE